MRHFIVLGFSSNSQADPGKQVYLGADREAAIGAVNAVDKKYSRRELFELAIPEIRRHAPPKSAPVKKAAVKDAE